jgi:hypothetical protein
MATVLAGVTGRPITYVDEPEDAGRSQDDEPEDAGSSQAGEAQRGAVGAPAQPATQRAAAEGERARGESRRAVNEALREFGAEMRAGRLAAVTGDVKRLTGRPTISFAQFARDYGWAFVKPSRNGVAKPSGDGVTR